MGRLIPASPCLYLPVSPRHLTSLPLGEKELALCETFLHRGAGTHPLR